jgi:hypothetical protein
MENKVPDRIPPKPDIAEAIHPEIGNGVSWETNQHHFLLRSPDPTKNLDFKLLDYETIPAINTGSEKTEVDIFRDYEEPGEINPNEVLSSIYKEITSTPGDVSLKEEGFITLAPKKGKEKPERKKKPKTHDPEPPDITASPFNREEPDNQLNPAKAGKLVRRAAKSVRRHEDEKKAVSQELTLTESTLSPYTQWLKGLKGSEYVHPYDDDFAFVQGSGPAKEGFSETFAELLVSQGYKEQAVEMYVKLKEKYPEKSGFFAAKIEALQ